MSDPFELFFLLNQNPSEHISVQKHLQRAYPTIHQAQELIMRTYMKYKFQECLKLMIRGYARTLEQWRRMIFLGHE